MSSNNKRGEQKIPFKTSRGKINVSERLKYLNETQRHAVLATVSEYRPYTSLIAFALTTNMKELIFATPKATRKYKNIQKNRWVSLLIDTRTNTEEDYMHAETVVLEGTANTIRRGKKWAEVAGILIKKHPKLKGFVNAEPTALMLVKVHRCFHVSKFQTVSEWVIR